MFDKDQVKRVFNSTLAAGLALVMVAVLVMGLMGPGVDASGPGEPDPGTVGGVTTWAIYPSTAITGNTTIYSDSPKWLRGLDMSRIRNYNSVDVFVTVDISGTATLTVTPQVSADGTNWVDATYNYVSDAYALTTSSSSTITATGVSTSSGTTTATVTTSSSSSSTSSIVEGNYQMVLSADGSDYVRMATMGEYIRFSLDYSGTMTPTINLTLRNN